LAEVTTATGKRKSAIARVRITLGSGQIKVNGRDCDEYFPRAALGLVVRQPLADTECLERYDISANICGGGIAGQALANRCVCVAAPAGGPDQPERINECAEAGLLVASPLDAGAIASRVQALLADETRRREIRSRIEGCGFRNGVPTALDLLERLAPFDARRS